MQVWEVEQVNEMCVTHKGGAGTCSHDPKTYTHSHIQTVRYSGVDGELGGNFCPVEGVTIVSSVEVM